MEVLVILLKKNSFYLPIVHPSPFHILGRDVLDIFGSLDPTKVPHGLNILMFCYVFGEMVPVTCDDVDNTPR